MHSPRRVADIFDSVAFQMPTDAPFYGRAFAESSRISDFSHSHEIAFMHLRALKRKRAVYSFIRRISANYLPRRQHDDAISVGNCNRRLLLRVCRSETESEHGYDAKDQT